METGLIIIFCIFVIGIIMGGLENWLLNKKNFNFRNIKMIFHKMINWFIDW